MAKKVKCIECDCAMNWAIPSAEYLKKNPSVAEHVSETIVCSNTMKTKDNSHCQYCEHYEKQSEFHKQRRQDWEKELEKTLEKVKEI